MKQATVSLCRLAVLSFSLIWITSAVAYEQYYIPDTGSGNCSTCHGGFNDGVSPQGTVFPGNSKHTMHRSSSNMATSCDLCHSSSDSDTVTDRNPFIGTSAGITGVPGVGCTGCHNGNGLRSHHAANSVTACASCHGASPLGPAENVKPPYYGTSGTRANNPCNTVAAANTNENWSVGDFVGLDNDGDNAYDTADSDCGPACSYAINPTGTNIVASGGTGSIGVTAGTSCVWTATPSAAWITITSGGTGSGNGTVNYSVAVNATTLARTGTVTVATKTFTIAQAGVCSYAINPASTNLTAAGGTGNVAVTAATGCAWSAASNAGWITITSGATGSDNGSVGYSVAANTSSLARTGTATIAGLTFTVNQAGSACAYVLNPTTQAFTSSGGTGSFSVTATAGCVWTATTGAAWITTTSSGSGNGTVNFSVGANASSLSRTGTIAVAGQTFTVTQTGVACTYFLNPTSQAFGANSGTGSFGVTAPGGCAWNATSNDAWVTVTGGASGSGNGTVNYSVAANVSIGARTGTVNVAGQAFTVTQSGAGCTYSLSPTNQTFAAASGPGSANVATPGGCAWSAASNDAWITITGGASGSGTGTVSYSVDGNTSSLTRVGTLTIAGKTLTVTQTGVACTYALTPTGQTFDSNGGSASFNVTATVGCAWSATANVPWLSVVSTGSVGYAVAPNTTSLTRTGAITVATQMFTVIQTGVACTFDVNPLSTNLAAGGGGGSLTVSAPGGCVWTATSHDGWIAIASGSAGSGNGTVTFNVGANTSTSSRTGTLTVAGQTFTVTQTGASASVVDLDIVRFRTTRRVRLNGKHDVRIRLWVKNGGAVDAPQLATVIGRQNGVTVFNQTFEVSALVAHGRVRYELPDYKPTLAGEILWTASIADDDPDEDVDSDTTNVKFQGENNP